MNKILVVDDEFGLAEALQALLADEGYEVMTAVNGQQGLEKLRDFSPDLVLLDYMMPVMNGLAVLEAMRKEPRHAETPVIVMSGVEEALLPSGSAKYDVYLRKPFNVGTLLVLLQKLIK